MFNHGDILRGKENNPYRYTTEHALMKVVEETNDGEIRVMIIEHDMYPDEVGNIYPIYPEYAILERMVDTSPTPFEEVEQLYAEATYWG